MAGWMSGGAYYNEIDEYASDWLENLIAENLIAPGVVDRRSIADVRPDDLRGFTQCHFFAGIGVWSYALRLAGWPDDRPVWTGSCPCQPFSAAGKGAGFDDERHLWPAFYHLIDVCRPPIVIGEQVASKDGLGWLDLVQTDLEAAGYAVGASDLCVAGVGGPHIRQRLWFVGLGNASQPRLEGHAGDGDDGAQSGWIGAFPARPTSEAGGTGGLADADCGQRDRRPNASGWHFGHGPDAGRAEGDRGSAGSGGTGGLEHASGDGWLERGAEPGERGAAGGCIAGGLADADIEGSGWRRVPGSGEGHGEGTGAARERSEGLRSDGGLADADGGQSGQAGTVQPGGQHGQQPEDSGAAAADRRPGPTNGFWRDADWLFCRDGKWRPSEPGAFPLVDGTPARVGRLRAYGNAISPWPAKAFIEAVKEICHIEG